MRPEQELLAERLRAVEQKEAGWLKEAQRRLQTALERPHYGRGHCLHRRLGEVGVLLDAFAVVRRGYVPEGAEELLAQWTPAALEALCDEVNRIATGSLPGVPLVSLEDFEPPLQRRAKGPMVGDLYG